MALTICSRRSHFNLRPSLFVLTAMPGKNTRNARKKMLRDSVKAEGISHPKYNEDAPIRVRTYVITTYLFIHVLIVCSGGSLRLSPLYYYSNIKYRF